MNAEGMKIKKSLVDIMEKCDSLDALPPEEQSKAQTAMDVLSARVGRFEKLDFPVKLESLAAATSEVGDHQTGG